MQHTFSYLHQRDWVVEGSSWRPPAGDFPLTLRDDAGAVIGSGIMTTMVLTLYDPENPLHPIITGADHVDIKNTRGCSLSTQGVFIFTLSPTDTVMLDITHAREQRRALLEYTWSAGSKADALEVTFVVKNLVYRV